ncbi:MAG: hypothetical protein L6R41_008193 [Letrouitia leprolyta]|nr:MAG: hypothetical protein L6R41_008193 [Letrouitia leprolyta]
MGNKDMDEIETVWMGYWIWSPWTFKYFTTGRRHTWGARVKILVNGSWPRELSHVSPIIRLIATPITHPG